MPTVARGAGGGRGLCWHAQGGCRRARGARRLRVWVRRISAVLRMDAAGSRGARRATDKAVVSSTTFCDARASLFADGVVHPIAFVEKAGRKHGDSCRHDDRKRLAGCSKRSVHEFLPLCAVCAPQRFHPVWALLLTGSLANAYLDLTNSQVSSSDESSPRLIRALGARWRGRFAPGAAEAAPSLEFPRSCPQAPRPPGPQALLFAHCFWLCPPSFRGYLSLEAFCQPYSAHIVASFR